MSLEASIDVQFSKTYLPKDIVSHLVSCNWQAHLNNKVIFLFPSDEDELDWQEKDRSAFDLEKFLNSHSSDTKIGLAMSIEDNIGVHFIIYPKWMTITLSHNRVDLMTEDKIPNFSWYLERLSPFFKSINVLALQCELVY